MNKALAIAGSVGGGGAIAVGGYYVIGNSIGGGAGTSEEKAQDGASALNLLDNIEAFTSAETFSPLDLNTFKTAPVKDKECVKDLFNNESVDLNANISNQDTVPNDFFGETADSSSKGCLIINYEKKKGNDKWSGAFTWTWAFVNNNKGFINFNSATTTADKKLKLTGGFYLVEKSTGSSPNTWTVKWKDEVSESGNEIANADLATKFPQLNPQSNIQINNKAYWGFLDDGAEQASQSSDTAKTTYKWILEHTANNGEGAVGIGEWSKDLEWWNQMYSTTKGKNFDLTSKLGNFKGTWKQIIPSVTPAAK